ncbi:BTAD domain-containing putative transcriptional regulator [Nocardia sp. NPDC050710]|uniref:AfsR/SARP family transcriptional regulator n=1 Tax=Nocardia sp. NPDC050710 TaxID=3157220 RepID=UPI0033DE8397
MTTPAGESVVVALLGEVALRRDGVLTAVPGARSRLLLTALALHPGRSRSAQGLIDDVWGEQPPRAPMNALHTQVSRLRSALPGGALEIGPAGYRLGLDADRVDLTLAAALLRRAWRGHESGDVPGCLEAIRAARALWRDEPGADLPAGAVADELRAAAALRLTELDAVELVAREAGGDLAGALRLARHIAARDPLDEPAQLTLMRLLAMVGRPNEALESFAAFRARLAEHLGADPGAALVELNTAILRGEPVGVPAAADSREIRPVISIVTPPTEFSAPQAIGLRAAPNVLLGREPDLTALAQSLRTARVTTVLGPGGVGKTRVANEVGALVARTGPVVLVELASVRAEMADARVEVEAAISSALGLNDLAFDSSVLRGRQAIDARQRLRDAVSARSLLLILDNCEHLIEAVAVVVADLIGAADRLTVLTTSRAPLMITAETVYPLPPLTIDPAGSPATELFAARARAVRPTVRLDPEIVAQLCHTLDGLPLAIELAAARVRVMSVEEINTRLADRFALLRHGDRSSPERHRTLHAVIDWSWNLLDPPQQAALRRLCRFPAGFGLSAAESVAGGPEVGDVAAAVDGLVNQSLLTVLDNPALGTRYRMLETVREYGEERLAASPGESELVVERMLRWAHDLADSVAVRYHGGDQVELALLVAAELDNLLAALRYALERRDVRTAYTVFPVVGTLWVIRGSHMEVVSWAERVFELEEPLIADGPRADLVLTTYEMMLLHLFYTTKDMRRIAQLRIRVRRLLRARTDLSETYRFIGMLMLSRSDGAGVARRIAEAIRHGESETRAIALLLRANVKENLGDVRGSTHDAIRALDVFGHDNVWSVAMVCRHLGQVCGQIANYRQSVSYYRRSLELLLQLGVYEDTVEIRGMLAASLIGMGDREQARRELEIAFGATDIGAEDNSTGIQNRLHSNVMQSSAELAFADGDSAEGLRRYGRALELYGWPQAVLGPGPGALMIAAAALDAKVLYGAAETGAALMRQLLELGLSMLSQYQDLPQIGGVACAIGSYLIASGRDPECGLRLLALAPKVYARQDFPSMRLDRHRALAEATLGDERVARAAARYGGRGRLDSARHILSVFGELLEQPGTR